MKLLLFFLLFLVSLSLFLNYVLFRRIDNLTITLIHTQDFQDKYFHDTLRANDLKLLTLSEFEPPKPRTRKEILR